jgi:hypothetical protein
MGQVYQCWWRICRETNVFSKFEYHMFYVLYPFVTSLLTFPRKYLKETYFLMLSSHPTYTRCGLTLHWEMNRCRRQAQKIFSSLQKEVSLYKAACTLPPNLKMLMDALLKFRPKSTQNERKFSTSGTFVTKHRSSPSDGAINDLCVSKFYVKNENF